jgi:glycosyltransferase involved in cell wall biosynthesis
MEMKIMKYKIAFEPHLDSINQAYNKYFNDKQASFDYHILDKPTWKSKQHFKFIKMLYFMLKCFVAFIKEYDLVHINGANFGIVAYLASFFGCKYIYTIHGCPHPDIEKSEGLRNRILSIISIQLMKIVIKRAVEIYTISKFSRDELQRDFAIQANVIYNGYDDSIFSPVEKHRLFCDKYFENKKLFISVGRMIESKQPFCVIDLFAKIASESSNCHLVFIGCGVLWDDAVAYSKQKNVYEQISFIKQVDYREISQYYAGCDYFISGCDIEGFGLVAIEALACGCLPLLPHAGAFPEIFGCEDFFYDFNNINMFKLPEENEKILLQWQEIILNNFKWEKVIGEYENEYRRVLKV